MNGSISAAAGPVKREKIIQNLLGLDNESPDGTSSPVSQDAKAVAQVATSPTTSLDDDERDLAAPASDHHEHRHRARRSHTQGHNGHHRHHDLTKADSQIANLAIASLEMTKEDADNDDDNVDHTENSNNSSSIEKKEEQPQEETQTSNDDHHHRHSRRNRNSHGGHHRHMDMKKQDSASADIAMAGLRIKHSGH